LFFAGPQHDARKSSARVFIDGFAVRGLGLVVEEEAGVEQGVLFGR
jgi:hypothetical protein